MGAMTRNLRQKATHWTATPDGFGGHTFGSPTVRKVRWEEGTTLVTDDSGQEIISRAQVYLDGDVDIGDYLFLGESTAADPTTLSTAYVVREFRKTTDLRNIEVLRKAFL